jgi:hypothetical protein
MKLSELKKQIEDAIVEILSETSTIDVPDPNTLTAQQKQTAINTARKNTKNPGLGTSKDPVDFV